jgi:predicted SnoaL-like aldol condensation-catalyzing enzyme
MKQTIEAKNKAMVLEAFDTLFNKRDYTAAERYWSPDYIQHSAHIAPGREGLFNLIKSIPPTFKYQPGTIVAEGEFVIVHGRFSGFDAPVNWIAADIVRIQNGILVEHWDVIQDEATEEQSISKRPMFGKTFRPTNEPERGSSLQLGSNVVSPGPIETPLTNRLPADAVARIVFTIPMERMGKLEIAKAALFLTSDDSSFVTGIELFVDGGRAQI